jgi:hypothetical protein
MITERPCGGILPAGGAGAGAAAPVSLGGRVPRLGDRHASPSLRPRQARKVGATTRMRRHAGAGAAAGVSGAERRQGTKRRKMKIVSALCALCALA